MVLIEDDGQQLKTAWFLTSYKQPTNEGGHPGQSRTMKSRLLDLTHLDPMALGWNPPEVLCWNGIYHSAGTDEG